MKTIKEFYKDAVHHIDGAEYNVDEVKLQKAMQEYADQQIEAYKLKLKEKINEMSQSPYDAFESNDNISADAVIELIDTTTP